MLNAYTLVFAALLIPAGRLADRIGRRRMFLTGVIVFTVGSMLCGLSPTVGVLIGAEMLEAVGAAMLVPASLALVLQTFPREKVPVAVAIWGAIGAVAGAFGPTLGALVVSNLSWRWAFFINLPVGIVSFFLGRKVLPEGREANPGRMPDPASIVVLAAGIALVVYAVVETQNTGWASARFAGVLAAGLGLLALFVDRCRRVPNPLIHLELFRSPQLPLGQRGDDRLRHRVQRDVPRQHAVPHQGVGLLDPARRAGRSPSVRSSSPSPPRSSVASPDASASGRCSSPAG